MNTSTEHTTLSSNNKKVTIELKIKAKRRIC